MLDNVDAEVFRANFPTVSREQAVRVLEHFRSTLNDISLPA